MDKVISLDYVKPKKECCWPSNKGSLQEFGPRYNNRDRIKPSDKITEDRNPTFLDLQTFLMEIVQCGREKKKRKERMLLTY